MLPLLLLRMKKLPRIVQSLLPPAPGKGLPLPQFLLEAITKVENAIKKGSMGWRL